MHITLKSLSPSQQEALNHAIQKIAADTGAEKIYCFGCRHTQKTEWSPFISHTAANGHAPMTSYDLLVVMPDKDLHYRERVEDFALKPVVPNTQFCYHVFDNFQFVNHLKDGNPFVNKVCREGVLLHDSQGGPLFNGHSPTTYATNANTATLLWVQNINLARRMYNAAERAASRGERWETLCHLEESACHACMALIALYLGHKQQQAMLSQLLLYCDNFCALKSRVFPCNTPEEAQLFQYLEMVVVKEEDDYREPIPAHIIDSLLKRVNKMLEIADWLYAEKTRTRTYNHTKPLNHA